MSEPYRGRRCGRSTAFPNLWARQSHPRVDELDSATTTTRHFDSRASCFSLDSTSASYQEALPPCTRPGQLTRTRTPFEPARPRERIENRQSGSYPQWLELTHQHAQVLRAALVDGDLDTVGRIAEDSALGMHATMESACPPVVYRTAASHQVLDLVRRLRRDGQRVWATMDAGPNVKVLCPAGDAARIAALLREATHHATLIARPGPGVTARTAEVV
ncbi:hypothetical protein ACPCKL_33085 [Streptomyces cellulosae]